MNKKLSVLLAVLLLSACSSMPRNEALVVRKSDMHKLDSSEIREVYERIAEIFPYQSKPIEDSGASMLFGQEAVEVLSVPALTTWKERADYCGVRSVSGSEVIGLSQGNPMAIAPKLWALGCSVVTKPNLFVKVPKSSSETSGSDEGTAFRGDQ